MKGLDNFDDNWCQASVEISLVFNMLLIINNSDLLFKICFSYIILNFRFSLDEKKDDTVVPLDSTRCRDWLKKSKFDGYTLNMLWHKISLPYTHYSQIHAKGIFYVGSITEYLCRTQYMKPPSTMVNSRKC